MNSKNMTREKIIKDFVPHYAQALVHGNLISFEVPANELLSVCLDLYHQRELPLKIISALDERDRSGAFRIMYVFGLPQANFFLAPFVTTTDEFPSITPQIHEASKYERKIHTFFGLTPTGHPDLRSLLLHDENWPTDQHPLRKDFEWNHRPAVSHKPFEFVEIGGEGIYEIPVGPVHAGIIEPGHFRFSMAGEEILMLEPRLGYSHKGSEKLFETLPLADKIRLAERVSGDSSCSHALAFCQALEQLSRITVARDAARLRVVFCELERLANHFGDIGAIMTDAGYNFGGAHGARLRERVMQINERLTGSRFLRGVIVPGGVTAGLSAAAARELGAELAAIRDDFAEIMTVAGNSNTLMNRLRDTGVLEQKVARDHGVVGVAARASGIAMDARTDYPYAAYGDLQVAEVVEEDGDVHARFRVRVTEVYATLDLLQQALMALASGAGEANEPPAARDAAGLTAGAGSSALHLPPDSYTVSIVEGWRGEIVYLVATDAAGDICRVDVRDPSFRNWTAMRYAARGDMIPDFPLINKSFNLSYSGNDL
ncbi:MAG: hydrogenase large subunit [Thermoleophilia bacterium]